MKKRTDRQVCIIHSLLLKKPSKRGHEMRTTFETFPILKRLFVPWIPWSKFWLKAMTPVMWGVSLMRRGRGILGNRMSCHLVDSFLFLSFCWIPWIFGGGNKGQGCFRGPAGGSEDLKCHLKEFKVWKVLFLLGDTIKIGVSIGESSFRIMQPFFCGCGGKQKNPWCSKRSHKTRRGWRKGAFGVFRRLHAFKPFFLTDSDACYGHLAHWDRWSWNDSQFFQLKISLNSDIVTA